MLTLPPPPWSPWPPLGLEPDRPADKMARMQSIAPGFVELARNCIDRMRQAAVAAEARYLEQHRDRPETAVGDFGPQHRHRTGQLEIVDAADPELPRVTVRRARLADPIARMVSRGELRPRHLQAAEALRLLVEWSTENSSSPLNRLGMPQTAASSIDLPPGSVARAQAALGRAWRAAWPFGAVVAWVALERRSLDDFARTRRVRRELCPQWLRLGLDALADHFGCVE